MATGKLPTPGMSLGSALASGSKVQIPALTETSSRGLNRLIHQLLKASPEQRPHTAAEVRDVSDRLAAPPKVSRRVAVAAAAAIAVPAAAAVWWKSRPGLPAVLTPSKIEQLTTFPGTKTQPALSPDAGKVAFSWRQKGPLQLHTLTIGKQTPVMLTEGPYDMGRHGLLTVAKSLSTASNPPGKKYRLWWSRQAEGRHARSGPSSCIRTCAMLIR